MLCYKVYRILSDIGIPTGLTEMGFNSSDIPAMFASAMPQVIFYAILSDIGIPNVLTEME